MITKLDVLLMVNVAQMFYVNDMEYDEIAEKLKISLSMVSEILNDAVEFGIVDIKITNIDIPNETIIA